MFLWVEFLLQSRQEQIQHQLLMATDRLDSDEGMHTRVHQHVK